MKIVSDCIDTNKSPLDPDDWNDVRRLGQRMVHDLCGMLDTLRQRPAWSEVPPALEPVFRQAVPERGEGMEATYDDFVRYVLPYAPSNVHPRFWGWVKGTGSAMGMLADLLASGVNCNVGGFNDVASRVEAQVLAWCREMLGFPADASGLLVSGASMANLIGLAVARTAKAGFDVRREGLQGAQPRLTLYASTETHSCIAKGVELLGLGAVSLRLIPVDAHHRIVLAELKASVQRDRAAGYRPICVVGNAGTVNTGAVDDLVALRAVADRENLWFHIDGAFGALAALSPTLRPQVRGLETADSLAFDLHKWMYMPYDVACVLVRDRAMHRATFAAPASYLTQLPEGFAAGSERWNDYGPQLSRGFRALKVWMCLKAYGLDAFRQAIERNVAQAAYLAARVANTPGLERVGPAALNVVCFRYVGAGQSNLNLCNQQIVMRLQTSGVAVPSHTVIEGQVVIRVAITNHRSRTDDFDELVHEVLRLGARVERERAAAR